MASAQRLKQVIAEAERVTAFTGAGISTECGIPDFRSPGGFWSKNKPIDFRDFVGDPSARRESWSRFLKLRNEHLHVQPGRGHKALRHLHAEGKMPQLITQNIDNLHQASGLPTEAIIELHGNGTYAKCLDCSTRHELDWCAEEFSASGECPLCPACGGLVKSATISFGQAMPEAEMLRAEAASLSCDLFLAIGSSLAVQPAASFPVIAAQNGARLVIVNRDETPFDQFADLVVREDIGSMLEAATSA
ncbi:MAG: NAD-dependent deacetylase [Rhizobiales bacterium]|nr:NAD-dependent deacetylase [Hyphomicrobiales bacterium]